MFLLPASPQDGLLPVDAEAVAVRMPVSLRAPADGT
jgi:hypothetical protein